MPYRTPGGVARALEERDELRALEGAARSRRTRAGLVLAGLLLAAGAGVVSVGSTTAAGAGRSRCHHVEIRYENDLRPPDGWTSCAEEAKDPARPTSQAESWRPVLYDRDRSTTAMLSIVRIRRK